jgi:predicted aspartyl protease
MFTSGYLPMKTLALLLLLLLLLGSGFISAEETTGSVPFEFFRNEILVEFHVGRSGPYLAMIDTGTDPSAIDLKLAKELGLKLGTGGEIDGGGTATVKAFETKLSVTVGPVMAKDVDALAGESVSMIATKLGRPIRAVLGKSFLQGRIVQTDYAHRILRFPNSAISTSKDHVELRFHYGDDVVLEDVLLNGKPVRAILDTGSNGSLKITPEAIDRLSLQQEVKAAKASQSTGFRGSYTSLDGSVGSVTLGTIRLEKPAATFWLPGTGHDGKPWDINIGNAILKDFVITLDTKKGILLIEKPEK